MISLRKEFDAMVARGEFLEYPGFGKHSYARH